jgi:hypothetical protein
MRTIARILTVTAILAFGGVAFAQSDEGAKTVGRKGATQLGMSFATTTTITSSATGLTGSGSSTSATTNIFGGVDIGRFVSDSFLLRFGINGSGNLGGQKADTSTLTRLGISVPATPTVNFNLIGGALYYMTPQKPQSFYLGGDMSVPMSDVGISDPYANARVGVQAAIRANASFFVEAGYGFLVSSIGSNGSLMSNIGVRVLF